MIKTMCIYCSLKKYTSFHLWYVVKKKNKNIFRKFMLYILAVTRPSPESLGNLNHLVKILKIWNLKIFFTNLGTYLRIKIFKNFESPKRIFH